MNFPHLAIAVLVLSHPAVAEEHAEMTVTEETLAEVGDDQVAAAEEMYQGLCRNCHGPKAQGLASYPKLSDAEPIHIATRLQQYRAKEKVGPNSLLMFPHASDLTDEEIAGLSVYVTTAFD